MIRNNRRPAQRNSESPTIRARFSVKKYPVSKPAPAVPDVVPTTESSSCTRKCLYNGVLDPDTCTCECPTLIGGNNCEEITGLNQDCAKIVRLEVGETYTYTLTEEIKGAHVPHTGGLRKGQKDLCGVLVYVPGEALLLGSFPQMELHCHDHAGVMALTNFGTAEQERQTFCNPERGTQDVALLSNHARGVTAMFFAFFPDWDGAYGQVQMKFQSRAATTTTEAATMTDSTTTEPSIEEVVATTEAEILEVITTTEAAIGEAITTTEPAVGEVITTTEAAIEEVITTTEAAIEEVITTTEATIEEITNQAITTESVTDKVVSTTSTTETILTTTDLPKEEISTTEEMKTEELMKAEEHFETSNSNSETTLAVPEITLDFEAGMKGFVQTGMWTWLRHSGPSYSAGTGPDSAIQGEYYGLFDASYPVKFGEYASMETKQHLDGQAPVCVEFDYHMYGSGVGELQVLALPVGEESELQFWEVWGSQGSKWIHQQVRIDALGHPYRVGFRAIRGINIHSDIAIDDVRITTGECVEIFEPIIEDFENGFSQVEHVATDIRWEIKESHDENGGHYAFVDSSEPNNPHKIAEIATKHVFDGGVDVCLSFKYLMDGDETMGSLSVLMDNFRELWSVSGPQGNGWREARVQIPRRGAFYSLGFAAETGTSYRSDIALDDIIIAPCSSMPESFFDNIEDKDEETKDTEEDTPRTDTKLDNYKPILTKRGESNEEVLEDFEDDISDILEKDGVAPASPTEGKTQDDATEDKFIDDLKKLENQKKQRSSLRKILRGFV